MMASFPSSSFPSSAWERQAAKLRFVSGRHAGAHGPARAGRQAELGRRAFPSRAWERGGYSLVGPDRRLHDLVAQRLLVQLRPAADARVLPGADVQEVLVVALGLAVGVLVILADVAAAR